MIDTPRFRPLYSHENNPLKSVGGRLWLRGTRGQRKKLTPRPILINS